MRLKNIVNEDYNTGVALTYRDLNSMQVAVLIKLAKGTLSEETASPRELAVLDSLINLNLVDDFYNLTKSGERAAQLGIKYGSFDRRRAAKQVASTPTSTDVEDNIDFDDTVDDDNDELRFR